MSDDRPPYPLRELVHVILTVVWGTYWQIVQRVARVARSRHEERDT